MNYKRINILKELAGGSLMVTNADFSESEPVSVYKDQWQIERSFRSIKSFLGTCPVYYRKED